MFTRNGIVRSLSVFLSAGLLCFIAVPKARATGWHQEIFVTVSGPVEIPGRVLGPGTYIFRLVHPSYSPDAVQIIDRHTSQVEGLFLTLPAYRAKATGKTIVKLQRPNSGYAVPEIKKWFYPGNNVGHTFIYSPAAREFMSSLRQQTHSAKG